MGTEVCLPQVVIVYLDLIARLSEMTHGQDSNSTETAIIQDEIRFYFLRVREEMRKMDKEYEI